MKKEYLLMVTIVFMVFATCAKAEVMYFNNFEDTSDSLIEWSTNKTDSTPTGRRFLGQFQNSIVNLTLDNLPAHTEITLSFDLYVIRSWDGLAQQPDIWNLSVQDGLTLLRTTFGNVHWADPVTNPQSLRQAYPGFYPGGDYPIRTGAAEVDTLGYTMPPDYVVNADSVYNLTFTFAHSESSLQLNFSAENLQDYDPLDESWGIDNVVLYSAVPEPADCWQEQQKLLASDGTAGDEFGYWVSINGDYAIIGAHWEDTSGSNSGSAYVYKYDGASWVQQAKLIASDGEAGDEFGASVSISGDYAIIGAPFDDGHSGSVYVFYFNGTNWIQQAKLIASDGEAGDEFGYYSAISGDYVVVGSHLEDDNGNWSGSAYIFKREGENWLEQAKLLASDGEAGDRLGSNVSISGDYVIVGAPFDDDYGSESGSAYIFKRDGSSWTQQAKLTASDGATRDYFGHGVSISGSCALVGSYGDEISTGSAYVFSLEGESWTEQQKLLASDGAVGDHFGTFVSMNGNYAVLAAVHYDYPISDCGSAYIFKRGPTNWIEVSKITASDPGTGDYFGHGISIKGNRVIIGAPRHDDNGSWSGSAYIFENICNTEPVADAGDDQTVEGESFEGTEVILDGSCSSDADSTAGTNDDIARFDWYKVDACDPNFEDFLGSGEIIDCNLPLGEHIIVLEVIDKAGAFDTNEITIIVQDTTPPEFTLSVTPDVLWPVSHKMVQITPSWTVSDICDDSPEVSLVSITMNEDDEAKGDGHTTLNIQIGDDGSIYLRAERSGTGSGRIYTITYQAVDDSGNAAVARATVTVPHDQR